MCFVMFETAKNVCDLSVSTWYSYVRSFGYYSYILRFRGLSKETFDIEHCFEL